MEQIKVNPNNKKYYSEDFIKGFECGVRRQFEADRKEGEFKNFDRADLILLIECQKERIGGLIADRAEGEWELASDNDGEYGICSICGNDTDFTHYGKPYHFCPNCGAKMK